MLSTLFRKRKSAEAGEPGGLRGFMRDVRGVAALEFGFIAPPFFLLLFSMFEVGLTYTADAVLQSAVNDTARMIRTGQVQSKHMKPEEFRDLVCGEIKVLLSCDERLQIDVRRFTAFGGAGFSSPLDSNGNFRDDYRFEPGMPCDVILVRAFYEWDPVTPGLGDYMSNMGGGGRLLMGTAAVRNEPYLVGGSSC
ncbi:MAG: pilus assembly protein [Micropepsaceae bacterium]